MWVLYKFRGSKNGDAVEESEMMNAEMKVFNGQIKMLRSFHHRDTLAASRSVTSQQVRHIAESFYWSQKTRLFRFCRYPFTKFIVFRILSKHGFQFVTLATVKISGRLWSDMQRYEVRWTEAVATNNTPRISRFSVLYLLSDVTMSLDS